MPVSFSDLCLKIAFWLVLRTVGHLAKRSLKMVSEKKKCSFIGTHNGQFHCDEALACYMLKLLPEFENCQIKRSRDPAVLNECDIIVDVGAMYDHSKMRYDHHQKEFKTTMKDVHEHMDFTTKLSSAGLVYAHYGMDIMKKVYSGQSIFCRKTGFASLLI